MARDIKIYRDIPVINGYIQAAPNYESEKNVKTAEDAITDLENEFTFDVTPSTNILLGSGRVTKFGAIRGRQSWIRLPGIEPDEWYTNKSGNSSDPMVIARS